MTTNTSNKTVYEYDVIVFGAGVAGLWLANTLKRAGFNILVVEKDRIGAGQTLASQGMIHGGQKYALTGTVTPHAESISKMPERWEASLGGWGEADLTSVKSLSDTQIMWPAGAVLSGAAVFAAAQLVNTDTRKMARDEYPEALLEKKKFKGPVYELPEKVIDTRSLLQALAQPIKSRIVKGDVTEMMPDGQVYVSGHIMRAQLVIFTSGAGNETALELLKVKERHTQRRPLRQIMVRSLPNAVFGHGITASPKPRVTITSHLISPAEYVWYLGGNIAEEGAKMDEDAAISFARAEMQDMFPDTDWAAKEWATLPIDRAEPFDASGVLPPGPFVHQRGKILMAWPVKLTFAPLLSDHVFGWLADKDIHPLTKTEPPPGLPLADIGSYPWEVASWKKAA